MKKYSRNKLAFLLSIIICTLQWSNVYASENMTSSISSKEDIVLEAVSGNEQTAGETVSKDGEVTEKSSSEEMINAEVISSANLQAEPEDDAYETASEDIVSEGTVSGDSAEMETVSESKAAESTVSEDAAGEEGEIDAAGEVSSITWDDYTAVKDDDKKILTLTAYKGSKSSIIVPAKVKIDETEYTVEVSSDYAGSKSIWANHDELKSISFDKGFKAPSDSRFFFADCRKLEKLDLTNFDTSEAVNMKSMFRLCDSIKEIDLSKFNTSKVTDMSGMFYYCNNLEELDLRSFDTSEVTDMMEMFRYCESLVTLNVSSFDTAKVTNMDMMFDNCSALTSLDVTKFNTAAVTDMRDMFSACKKLTELDVSQFNTSSAEKMDDMFYCCTGLQSLDVSNFNTSKVTSMSGMFSGCENLSSLTLGDPDTSKVTDMGGIFMNCLKLETLDVSKLETGAVNNMTVMFSGCKSLKSLELGNFITGAVKSMSGMFSDCKSLTSLDLSEFDTANVTEMGTMFSGCESLTSLNLGKFNTANVTEMGSMFYGCSSLTSLDLSSFKLSSELYAAYMFCNTVKLQTIKTPVTTGFSGTIDLFGKFSGGGYENTETLPNSLTESIELTKSSDIPLRSLSFYYFGNPAEDIQIGVNHYGTNAFTVKIDPLNATDQRLEWSSTDETVALYAGVLKSYKAGTATITVKSVGNPSVYAACKVTVTDSNTPVIPPEEPVVDPETETKYTVKFMNDNVLFASQTVVDGETVKEPEEKPSKDGYSFLGWTIGSTLYNFSTPVHSDLTLSAKFVADSKASASENSGSGMDPVPKVTKDGTICLVKNQSYILNGQGWVLKSGSGIISVSAKNGKITGKKKGTAEVSNADGTENYRVVVAEPAFEKESKNVSGVLVGSVTELKFSVNAPNDLSAANYDITWCSSNPKVAVVNDGKVTAVAKGTVKIKACVGGKVYTSRMSVTDICKAPAKQTTINGVLEFNMNPLQSFNLKYDTRVFKVNKAKWSGDGMNAISKNGIITGYKNSVVSITKNGKIKAVGSGSTQITGDDGTNKVNIKINVVAVPAAEAIYLNKDQKPTVKIANVKNAGADWWKSSDESVFTVSKQGKLNGKKYGTGKVSCSYNGFVFTSNVFVEEPELETDEYLTKNGNNYSLTMSEGSVYNRVKLKNTYQTVNFVSNRPANVFIDENGIVYARKGGAGKVNITGSINGKKIKIVVDVK